MDDDANLIPGPNDSPSVGGSDSPRRDTPVASDPPKSSGESGEVLRLICSWCKTVLRDGRAPASHGICAQCSKRFFAMVALVLVVPSALLFMVGQAVSA